MTSTGHQGTTRTEFGWFMPQQRTAGNGSAPRPPADEPSSSTLVLPYVGSASSRRTGGLRAWMLIAPVDLAASLAPLLWEQRFWKGIIFASAVTVVFFAFGGLYRSRRHMSILDELPVLFVRQLASAAVVAMLFAARHDSVEYVDEYLRAVAFAALLVTVGRAVTLSAIVRARRLRWVERTAIVVGTGPIAVELARLLRRYPRYGLRFAGFVDDEPPPGRPAPGVQRIGDLDDLARMMELTECEVLLIADPNCTESRLAELIRQPGCLRSELWVVPRLRDFGAQARQSDHIGAIPISQPRRPTLAGPSWAVKRASDIVFATLALLLVSPLLLLCAIGSRIEGGPGVLFRQQRIGRYGLPFELLKFRSMRPVNEAESQTTWSVAHDPRVGPLGRFMRRTSLDELPQLWNILRGDMTVVGPRPERPHFVEIFSAEHRDYALRHRVPVGLTGLAQVSGLRGDTPISDRARFDNYYIENWSLWLDVKVVLRTITEVFRGGGR